MRHLRLALGLILLGTVYGVSSLMWDTSGQRQEEFLFQEKTAQALRDAGCLVDPRVMSCEVAQLPMLTKQVKALGLALEEIDKAGAQGHWSKGAEETRLHLRESTLLVKAKVDERLFDQTFIGPRIPGPSVLTLNKDK